MTINTRTVATAALLTLSVVSAGAQQSGPVMLRMKFAKGTVTRYRMSFQMNMKIPVPGEPKPMSQEMDSSMVIRQEVTRTLAGGGGEVKSKAESAEMLLNGRPGPAPAQSPTSVLTMDSRGRIVDAKTDGEVSALPGPMKGLMGPSGMSSLGMVLPDHAVRPGDAWTNPISIPGFVRGGSSRTTFVRFETVGHYRTARLHSVLSMPISGTVQGATGGRHDGEGAAANIGMGGRGDMVTETNFAISEGKVVRSTGNGGFNLSINTPPTAAGRGTTAMPRVMKMAMKMNLGMNILP